MKFIKRILFLFTFIILYLIGKEAVSLYFYLSSINQYFAIGVMAVITGLFIYFGIIPVIKIFALRVSYGPTKHEAEIDKLITNRMELFKKNPYVKELNLPQTSLEPSQENYDKIVSKLENKAAEIRKKYVNQVFYSTSISQNGFLDAILIFSTSVNMVKDIFILYNGRVSNKDLLVIAKKVYYSILIGGSEGVEYATEEIFAKFATDTIRSVPFLDKILSSLADGFINATLLTRVSLITENYCKKLYIKKDRELYPSPKYIVSTAHGITADILTQVRKNLFTLAKERSESFLKKAVNPVTVVLGKSYDSVKDYEAVSKTRKAFSEGFNKIKDSIGFSNKTG